MPHSMQALLVQPGKFHLTAKERNFSFSMFVSVGK